MRDVLSSPLASPASDPRTRSFRFVLIVFLRVRAWSFDFILLPPPSWYSQWWDRIENRSTVPPYVTKHKLLASALGRGASGFFPGVDPGILHNSFWIQTYRSYDIMLARGWRHGNKTKTSCVVWARRRREADI